MLHVVDDITTDTIVHVLKDTLLCYMFICRAQCYDGASNIKKAAKEIKSIEPRALYLHCYGHSLNLAVADTFKGVKVISDVMDHALEICMLLKYSPRRDSFFISLSMRYLHKCHTGLCNLCPTQWIVRAASLESIRLNYETLEATWEEALDVVRELEVEARINGVAAIMKTFDFLFGLILAERAYFIQRTGLTDWTRGLDSQTGFKLMCGHEEQLNTSIMLTQRFQVTKYYTNNNTPPNS